MSNYVSGEWGEVYQIGKRSFETDRESPITSHVSQKFFVPVPATVEKSSPLKLEALTNAPDSQALVLAPKNNVIPFAESVKEVTALTPPIWHQRIIEYPPENDFVYTVAPSAQPTLRLVKPAVFAALATVATCSTLYLALGVNFNPQTTEKPTRTAPTIDTAKVRYIEMSSPKNTEISAQLYLDEQKNQCLLMMKNLPDSAADQIYQVWYCTKDANFIQAASFKGNHGSAQLQAAIPAELSKNLDRIVVSLEPKSGAKFPAGPILLRAKI